MEFKNPDKKESFDEYLKKATNPNMYNSLNWVETMSETSPWRDFLIRSIDKNISDLEDKTVLDVGSGNGEMYDYFMGKKVKSIEGIEPSSKQVMFSKQRHPNFEVHESTIEEFNQEKKYDRIFLFFVSEHILDIDSLFLKLSNLVKLNGEVYIAIVDESYEKQPRFGYDIKVFKVDDEISVVKSTRSAGVMYDIVRPVDNIINAAKKVNLEMVNNTPIVPDEQYISRESRYSDFKDTAIAHFLSFKKVV